METKIVPFDKQDILSYVEKNLNPSKRRKCIYNLTLDEKGEPYIFINYEDSFARKIDLFKLDYVRDSLRQENDNVSAFASSLTREIRDSEENKKLSPYIKPIVYDPTLDAFDYEYGEDLGIEDRFDVRRNSVNSDIVLGFIIDPDLSSKLDTETKISLLTMVINMAKKLFGNRDFKFLTNSTFEEKDKESNVKLIF